MRNGIYFTIVKAFGYLSLILMVASIGYSAYLSLTNWGGIAV